MAIAGPLVCQEVWAVKFDERVRQLVEETLSGARVVPVVPDTCLMVNPAARELEECGGAALPYIEQGIRDRVAALPPVGADRHAVLRALPELLDGWIVYFHLGFSGSPDRVLSYLRSFSDSVLATAFLAARCAWPERGERITVPAAFLDFADQVGAERGGEAAEIARWLRGLA